MFSVEVAGCLLHAISVRHCVEQHCVVSFKTTVYLTASNVEKMLYFVRRRKPQLAK